MARKVLPFVLALLVFLVGCGRAVPATPIELNAKNIGSYLGVCMEDDYAFRIYPTTPGHFEGAEVTIKYSLHDDIEPLNFGVPVDGELTIRTGYTDVNAAALEILSASGKFVPDR